MNTTKVHNQHEHSYDKVVRQRGQRYRRQCSDCPNIGPWETTAGVQDTNSSVRLATTPETKTQVSGPAWDDLTVNDLRQHAKEYGITGYSKMKKSDLIKALEKAEDDL